MYFFLLKIIHKEKKNFFFILFLYHHHHHDHHNSFSLYCFYLFNFKFQVFQIIQTLHFIVVVVVGACLLSYLLTYLFGCQLYWNFICLCFSFSFQHLLYFIITQAKYIHKMLTHFSLCFFYLIMKFGTNNSVRAILCCCCCLST